MQSTIPTVLYVDDEYANLMAFRASFRRDFDITLANNASEAFQILRDKQIDLLISDQVMPEMNGVELLEYAKEKHPDTVRILITAYADLSAVIDSINKGQVYRYITKPWDENQLRLSLLQAYEVLTLRRENEVLVKRLQKANNLMEQMLKEESKSLTQSRLKGHS